jgi:glucose/arabinose dehydrogenase
VKSARDWTRIVIGATLAVASAAASLPALAGTPEPGYSDVLYVGGLAAPTAIAFLPDGRLLIVEKGGGVRLAASPPVAQAAADAGSIGVCTDSEMGLLGVAIDPDFATNGKVFFYRTEDVGGCLSASGRSNEIVTTTLTNGQIGALDPLLTGIRTDGGNHDGGCLRIGPDGKLYASVGDTGINDGGPPGASTNPYAQSLAALEGKILRLERDGSVPSDNPFVGQAGARPEIFAYGLRNPFRMGFDPIGGRLWAADVGQSTIEEVDVIVAGGNYGWPQCEGTLPAPACPDVGEPGAPVYEYDRSGQNASITGGAFAVGGAQAGRYFFGDYVFGTIWVLDVNPTRDGVVGAETLVVSNAGGPVDFVFGPDGALYYVSLNAGEVRRVGHAGFGTTTTTSTSSTLASSTTTTSLPVQCDVAPTYPCALAAIDDVAAQVAGLGDVSAFGSKLRDLTADARAEVLVASADAAQARKALRRALVRLRKVKQRLQGKGGRRRIAPETRAALVEAVSRATVLVRALRS